MHTKIKRTKKEPTNWFFVRFLCIESVEIQNNERIMNCNYRNFINTKIYFDSRTNVTKTNRFSESETQKRTMNVSEKNKKRHYLCRIIRIVFASFAFVSFQNGMRKNLNHDSVCPWTFFILLQKPKQCKQVGCLFVWHYYLLQIQMVHQSDFQMMDEIAMSLTLSPSFKPKWITSLLRLFAVVIV